MERQTVKAWAPRAQSMFTQMNMSASAEFDRVSHQNSIAAGSRMKFYATFMVQFGPDCPPQHVPAGPERT